MNNEPNLNISLNQTQKVECECGNNVFIQGMMFRKASKFLTGTSQDAMIPIDVYVCNKCNEPLKELLPKNLPLD